MHRTINANINVIGSIPDYELIYFSLCEMLNIPVDSPKIYQFRTSRTTKRFSTGINDCFAGFVSEEHKALCSSALINPYKSNNDILMILLFQMVVNNELFRLITDNVFMNIYYSGRTSVRQEDILAYLNELRSNESYLQGLTKTTYIMLSSKYLTALKKFGILSGRQKKEFNKVYFSNYLLAYFVYLINIIHPGTEILRNPLINYSFMDSMTFIERIKKREFASFWDLTIAGNQIHIELKKPISEFANVQFG